MCCVRRVRVCVVYVARMAVVCNCIAAMACVCSVAFRCVGSSMGQQERCCGLDRCQLAEGAACCRSDGVAASSGRAWSSWAMWSESRGSWRECQVWRIAPGASAYLYPRAPSCWGSGFHFSVKKAKIQEHLAPRRSSPMLLFIFLLGFPVCASARESEARC